MQNRKIVVIGDEDVVFGLGLIGLEGHAVASVEEAKTALQNAMADSDVALILLTENWSELPPELRHESGPLIVEIPCRGSGKPPVALEARIQRTLGIRLES
jgi:V/A-type H+/Na+-transporting ATPase subunit F